MEGVQRIYDSGIQYAKRKYLPNTVGSLLYILLYTVIVYYVTEYLVRGVIGRTLYLGTVVMIVAMLYSGAITLDAI